MSDRWKFIIDGTMTKATPDEEKMNAHIKQGVDNLMQVCFQAEERMILESSTTVVLVRIQKAIEEILKERFPNE